MNAEDFYYEKEIAERIRGAGDVIIYGAGVIARQAAVCFMGEPYCCNIKAFMVSDKKGNPDTLFGKSVISVEERDVYKNTLVIVIARENNTDDIKETLYSNGFFDVVIAGFDSDLWSGLRGNFYRLLCKKKRGNFLTLEETLREDGEGGSDGRTVHLYVVRSHVDRKISDDRTYPWEREIQAGAALTDKVISKFRDNTGENISEKNKSYCECTALYWIWKNDTADFAGLGHYRRHFDLTKEQLRRLGSSSIDVVLTIPVLNIPNVRAVYEKDHVIDDWDQMLQVIRELHPDYYEAALEQQNEIYYYGYNMFIARKEILDEYCEWLFSILERCEERCRPHVDGYQARYIGFLAERLLSIFFLHNWDRWKIVHARRNFLS